MSAGEAADWLDIPAEADWLDIGTVRDTLPDYLKLPELDTPSTGIQVQRADAQLKDIRFEVMKGSSRVWACNGRYVACRPSGFHEGSHSRHQRFLAAGHYRHVATYDDVQVFELQPGSPFYRTEGDVRAGNFYELLRAVAMAAVARDWKAYVDLLEEIATRYKSTAAAKRDVQGGVDTNWAQDQFMSTLDHLDQLIFMRWTHNQILVEDKDYVRGGKAVTRDMAFMAMKLEIDRGVSEVRIARGEKRSGAIARPRGPLIIR